MQLLYALAELRTPFLDRAARRTHQLRRELVFAKRCHHRVLVREQVLRVLYAHGRLRRHDRQPVSQACLASRARVEGLIFRSSRAPAPRPPAYSFPSGHTQNVFASFGCLGRWTKRTWLRVVYALLIVVTAFSRMYLGVHTPLDVGVSFGIGLVLVFALYPLFPGH